MSRFFAPLVVVLAPLLLAGCSKLLNVDFSITVDESLHSGEHSLLIVVSEEGPTPPADAGNELPWGLLGSEGVPLVNGTTSYEIETSTCCEVDDHTRWFYAFIDLNDNGAFDAGEPAGAAPGNPVTYGSDYQAAIVIE